MVINMVSNLALSVLGVLHVVLLFDGPVSGQMVGICAGGKFRNGEIYRTDSSCEYRTIFL